MAHYQLLVLAAGKSGREDEFLNWYDDRHLEDVLRVPGVVHAQRLEVQRILAPMTVPAWTTVAVFDLECEDPQTVLDGIKERLNTAEMPFSDAADRAVTVQLIVKPIPFTPSLLSSKQPDFLETRRSALPQARTVFESVAAPINIRSFRTRL